VTVDDRPAEPTYWLRPMVCTTVGLLGNIVLAGAKILVGVAAASAALVADGFHSLADVLSDVGILLALKASSRPPDDNHPYGHHSFETLGAVLVAAFMIFTAVMIGRDAVRDVFGGEHATPRLLALAASLGSVVAKEAMARYTFRSGRANNSPALLANAAMHRSDAVSSLAAAVGIGGAMAGWPVLDSLAALVIAVMILKMGWDLLRENVMALMDTMPDRDLVQAIRTAAEDQECVQEVRDLHVRQRGSWYYADLRIAVHPDHTLAAAHGIAHATEDRIRRTVEKVARVFVHVEPGSPGPAGDCPDHLPAEAATSDPPDRPG
jgi:cation diffusion facilitator family transporter